MKFLDFKKAMKKNIFTFCEAQVVAFKDNPATLKLQIHNWIKQGELVPLKRGVYVFFNYQPKQPEIVKALYSPCYISLEYALSFYGLIPEAVFETTLVTTKPTRYFKTPFGRFSFRTIKEAAFTGYDFDTLMALREKALVDFFYLEKKRLIPDFKFWEEMRFEKEDLKELDFKKIFSFARLFKSKKLTLLLTNLQNYAES